MTVSWFSTIRASSQLLLYFMAITVLSGCVAFPWPHMVVETPQVSGVLHRGGSPLANTPVLLASGEEASVCGGKTTVVETNQEGRFDFEAHEHFSALVVVMAHCLSPWALCAKDGENWNALFKAQDYTLCDSGPYWKTDLECDLERNGAYTCNSTDNIGGDSDS